jgi:hypothetical protein
VSLILVHTSHYSTHTHTHTNQGKKRKKAGLSDLPEMAAAEGRVLVPVPAEGHAGVEVVVHRAMQHVDVSNNGTADAATKAALHTALKATFTDVPLSATLDVSECGMDMPAPQVEGLILLN